MVTYSMMIEGARLESNGSTLHKCKISARFRSLTEMSRDRIGQTETAKTKTAQTETAQTETARPNRLDRIGQIDTARPKSPVPMMKKFFQENINVFKHL